LPWRSRHGAGALVRDIDLAAVRVTATPTGKLPTAIGEPITVLVAVAITDTVPESSFAT
jgi:hypothetical protein